MSFLSSPFYVQQIIVILFIVAFFLSILSIFLSILFCKKAGLITLSSIPKITSTLTRGFRSRSKIKNFV